MKSANYFEFLDLPETFGESDRSLGSNETISKVDDLQVGEVRQSLDI